MLEAASPGTPVVDRWADAALAVCLFAIGFEQLGGIVVRSGPGPRRDEVTHWIRSLLPAGAPLLRVPLHVTDDRLLGGLSLAATLRERRIVMESGILGRADGGVLLVSMAERLSANTAAHLCGALDRGAVTLERDGLAASVSCRVGVIALDEGIEEERVPAALQDRLAFFVDLTGLASRFEASGKPNPETLDAEAPDPEAVARARAALATVDIDQQFVEALAGAALAMGVSTLRGPLLAATAARAHAALHGRNEVVAADAIVAARLVLAPRATQMPSLVEEEESQPPPEDQQGSSAPEPGPEQPRDPGDAQPSDLAPPQLPEGATLDDVVLAAAKSGIPVGLLDGVALRPGASSGPIRTQGHAGVAQVSMHSGRPTGTRAMAPRSGERLNVIETLRSAAPWQRLRSGGSRNARIEVRPEDLRITTREQRSETSVVFCVDASGSAALQRLAEAKGAVEQVLADCYARRDHVALIAFRGKGATLLLPPTRSLARARKCLADLAGGGTTPIASGIDAALALALACRKRGQTPVLVMMTDARANIARDGRSGAELANADALQSACAVRAAGVRAIFLDTAPRSRPQARALALEMGARYLPLPYLDEALISRHVQSVVGAK